MGQVKVYSVAVLLVLLQASTPAVQGQSHGELDVQIHSFSQALDGRVRVSENTPIGSFLALVSVSNTAGADAVCSIDNPVFGLQILNPNEFRITLATAIDREVQASHVLAVRCRAQTGSREVTGQATVPVDVLDVNDHAPQFDQSSYQFAVSEHSPPGTSLGTVRATDSDDGANAVVVYSVTGHDVSIDAVTGVIFLARLLDREQQSQVHLTVTASNMAADGPPLSSHVQVDIIVNDINDHAPTAAQAEYLFQVHQGASAGTEIGSLLLLDQDDGPNGQLTSTLASNSSPFVLQNTASERPVLVTSVQLGPEHVGTHQLVVIVSDHGMPSRTTHVPVTVTVVGN